MISSGAGNRRGVRTVLWAVMVIAVAGAWAELLSAGRLGDAVLPSAVLILAVTLAVAAGWAALDIRVARSTRALVAGGAFRLAGGAAWRLVATTIFGFTAAAALFANCGTGSAQTASGPWASEYGADPGGFWSLAPVILVLLATGLAAPALIAICAAALIRAGRIPSDLRSVSRVRLAVLVGVIPLAAAYFIASGHTPQRCSLAMGRCAAGTGGTFVAAASLGWLPVLYFLAGTLLAAVARDRAEEGAA